ncbi:hypothetical protein [Candidatus Nitrosacidococcus tergens]|uniref:Uncharacterized protein n=1 Tax=Candidatus Nitrosacidococcus tergens TaxID=553981 RepID=A0A7G1QAF3_9GAMM|nr:hypothetical protein [Candidatus Nitrosacidococcus tergens]CAB1275973.1 conserved protein of unknown function [Candidatus Nitrosacidococcus tergens]
MSNDSKKEISSAHLDGIRKAWLVIIPSIIAIIGTAIFTGSWLALIHTREKSPVNTVKERMHLADRVLYEEIQKDTRKVYLQLLEAKIGSDTDQVDKLSGVLDNLDAQRDELIAKYLPSYAAKKSSKKEEILETMVGMPYPVIFTMGLSIAILLFILVHYSSLIIINRKYPPPSEDEHVEEI